MFFESWFPLCVQRYLLSIFLQETDQLEYILPKKTSLAHRLPMGDEGFINFVRFLLEVDPEKRPSASEAKKHPWLSYEYESSAGGYLATED